MHVPFCPNGGLTLIPMPGFEVQAEETAVAIEAYGKRSGKALTPVDIKLPVFGKRASDEPFLRFDKQHVGGHDCVIIGSGPGTWEMLGQLNLLLRYAAGRRAKRIALSLGYFPLSRSDKDEGELEFSLPQYFIEQMIQSATTTRRHLDRIITVDMHAPQMVMAGPTGLITELSLVRLVLMRAVSDAINDNERVCILCPDASAYKRIKAILKAITEETGIRLPVVMGNKERENSEDVSLDDLVGDTNSLRGATALSVDDEMATAGTNLLSATRVKEAFGANKVYSIVTHGVFCDPAATRLSAPDCAIDRVYATDTIPVSMRPHLQPLVSLGRLIVFEWAQELGVALYHHHHDLSVRVMR